MTRSASDVLKDIRETMCDHTRFSYVERAVTLDGLRLWFILTALRGPDNGDPALKSATTEVIRFAVFGRDTMNEVGAAASPDCEMKAAYRRTLNAGSDHFQEHARSAFRVLGLKWDKVNEQKDSR